MKTALPIAWIFPLTVFGIGAASIRGLDLAFNSATRWLLLAGVALLLLSRAKLFLSLRTTIAPAIALWVGWAALTVLWSDLPLLSLLKAVALAITVLSLVSGGVFWAQYAKPEDPLIFLAPLSGLALAAGVFGLNSYRHIGAGVPLFQGLSNNVNAFAIIIALGLAYPLYAAYRAARAKAWLRLTGWSVVVLLLSAFLVMTRARASIAAGGCILLAFALAALPRRVMLVGAACAAVAAGAIALSPLSAPIIGRATHFIDKGRDGDLYFSRRDVWRISYEHAVNGGIIGLGLGVSDETSGRPDDGDSLASVYGRQKGNSQLAIVEETGLTGLAIYAWLVGRMFWVLISGAVALPNREAQVAAALSTGVLAGLLAQSVFEAWWTAAGSFGSMTFWATAGVGVGILRRWRPSAVHGPEIAGSPITAGVALAPTL